MATCSYCNEETQTVDHSKENYTNENYIIEHFGQVCVSCWYKKELYSKNNNNG